MKKILILLAAMTLVTGFAMAQIGLTATLEGGVENVSGSDTRGTIPGTYTDKMNPWVTPAIAYTYPLMDGALDLNAKLGFPLKFGEERYFDGDGEETIYFGLIFNIGAVYHLPIGEAGKLDLGLAHEMDSLGIMGVGEDLAWSNVIKPTVRYGHTLSGIGEFFGELVLQFKYLNGPIDAEDVMSFYTDSSSIGWNSEFGLGAKVYEIAQFWSAADGDDDFAHGAFGFVLSYNFAPMMDLPLTVEVDTQIRDEVDMNGIMIAPKVSYVIMEGLSAYVKCELDQIAIDGADLKISPSLGVSYSF